MRGTMTEEQCDALLTKIEEWNEAMDAGEVEKALDIGRQVPYPAGLLMDLKKVFGKEYLVKMRINLRLAEEAYGKDWLDQPDR